MLQDAHSALPIASPLALLVSLAQPLALGFFMLETPVRIAHSGSPFDGLTGVLVEIDRRGQGVSVRLDTLPAGMFGHVRMFGVGQVEYPQERQIVVR